MTEVHRHKAEWQRTASQDLSTGKTADALAAYEKTGGIIAVERRDDARSKLLARSAHDAKQEPTASQLVVAYTRDEVRALNTAVRALRPASRPLRPIPRDPDRTRQSSVCDPRPNSLSSQQKKTLGV